MRRSTVIPFVLISSIHMASCDQSTQSNQLLKQNDSIKNQVTPQYIGLYQGTTPCMGCFSRCDDCPGMAVDLQLNADQTYVLSRLSLSGHNQAEEIKCQFKFINTEKSLIQLNGVPTRNIILVDLVNKMLEIRIDGTGEEYENFDDFSLNLTG